MSRDDVERITANVIRGLSLELLRGDFTDPNGRTIVLKLNGVEIDRVSFDVSDRPEYGDY